VIAVIAAASLGSSLSAHRRDEYLQAARLAVAPTRVDLELDLTPGITVADTVIAEIDPDRNGEISPAEKQNYVRRVLSAVELAIDGRPLQLEPLASTFPDLTSTRGGDGTIQLQAAAVVPRLTSGGHRVSFRNTYRRAMSAYLANALAPADDRIVVAAQSRDPDQHSLTIDYVVRGDPPASLPLWPLGVVGVAAVFAARLTRP
jgi:hypothetical protein